LASFSFISFTAIVAKDVNSHPAKTFCVGNSKQQPEQFNTESSTWILSDCLHDGQTKKLCICGVLTPQT
jgi:hypothetical protein